MPVLLGGERGLFLDYPAVGSTLVALAVWELAESLSEPDPERAERAVRLLVLAERFGYNRQLPSLAWAPAAALAERVRPGELTRIRAEIGARPAPDLRDEALRLLASLR